ncbi:hypothetical protein PENSPDRAFT_648298 [Peniophora sp. CONT]|nr:hypothetical protein PENSPDRAFT_648298 [Peniophora sp. CONT]
MFALNVIAAALAALAPASLSVSAAPLAISSIYSPHLVSRQAQTSACMMEVSGLTTNLAAAQGSMNSVAQDFNSTALQDVQAGIAGAMDALTTFQGAVANQQQVSAELPNAMVANVTMAINELDNVNGVPTAADAATLSDAMQQLITASQYAMMLTGCATAPSESASASAPPATATLAVAGGATATVTVTVTVTAQPTATSA